VDSGRLTQSRVVLDELRSKELLRRWGVPTVAERAASNARQAVDAAAELGFPVVLKGVGEKLNHKTERGAVHTDLRSPHELELAVQAIETAVGSDLEALVVQRHLHGHRELMAGVVRDPVFGPVVMVGVGGVLAEAIADIAFRICPVSARDAEDMVGEIRARSLLDDFRGERPADRGQLIGVLRALSRLAEERPDVVEVDINPLKISPDGSVTAVDALVILDGATPAKVVAAAVDPRQLGAAFYPRSVAIVGASGTMGKWGYLLPMNLIGGGYEGDIHLVNPTGEPIAGRRVCASLDELPDGVDLAVIAVPAAQVKDLLPGLRAKGVRSAVVISSGFSETGDAGRLLEEELVAAAREAGVLLIGPNTMGICNPHRRLYCTGSHVRPKAGSTALVAQSGNMGTQLLAFAAQQGIGIRAFCGSGNEAMVTIEDFMEAFEDDDASSTVVLYVEGIRDGRRFFASARRVGLRKPVVVLKGGRTAAGARAAASHTGALASDAALFSAGCRQAGVIEVRHPMDLLDLSAGFSSLPLPAGPRVAIMTLGGGWGVVASDLCEEHGLEVVPLDDGVVARIDALLPPFWSRANPVDLVGSFDPEVSMSITEELARWPGCDAVLNLGIVGRSLFMRWIGESIEKADPTVDPDTLATMLLAFEEAERSYIEHVVQVMRRHAKPVIGVKLLEDDSHDTVFELEGEPYRGVFFQTPERAVQVLARMVQYGAWRKRHGGP
jgi:acyl-CoA synthetase (NDP forming)